MRLLLGTHVFVWTLSEDRRLGPAARRLIAEDAEEVVVSALSLWEIALKAALGRMPVSAHRAEAAIAAAGCRRLDLTGAHVLALAHLPAPRDHRDPFDRMLVAQAPHEGLKLMTADPKLAAYGVPTVGCG